MTVSDGVIITQGGLTVSAGPIAGFSTFTTTGQVTGGSVAASGNTGVFSSTARVVGQRASTGTPTSGTYNQGDIGLDSNGTPMVCSAAGTPGTWHALGAIHWSTYTVGPGGSIDTSSNPGGDITVPSGFRHALLVCSQCVDGSTNSTASFGGLQIAVAGGSIDTGTNYLWTDASWSTNTGGTSVAPATNGANDSAWRSFVTTGGSVGAAWPSSARVFFPDYSSTSTHKTAEWEILQINSGTIVRRSGAGYYGGSAGALTKIHCFSLAGSGLAANTVFELYMIP